MKKIFAGIVLLSLIGLMMMPLVVSAQPPTAKDQCTLRHNIKIGNVIYPKTKTVGEPALGTAVNYPIDQWGIVCMMDVIYAVVDWISYVVFAVAGIIILFAGLQFASAAGDPEKTTKAKKLLVGALIGIVVAVFARAIPSIIIAILGA